MVSEKFRRQLRQEATQWCSDELISSDVYRQLAERYDFDSIDLYARDRFIAVLVTVGSVLLGIGVITFVAANWQGIPRSIKALLLLSVLIAFNTIGFYLWRSPQLAASDEPAARRPKWHQRLGHGFLICGAIVLGANFALMGQLFHQDGTAFGLCIFWGLGVAAMAYGLRLTSLGAIALSLIIIGYWAEFVSFEVVALSPLMTTVFNHLPLFIAVVFLPLVYWCRSRILFGFTVIGISLAFVFMLGRLTETLQDPFRIISSVSLMIPPALWWAYTDQPWGQFMGWHNGGQNRQSQDDSDDDAPLTFRAVGRVLSIVYLGCLFYGLSFHGVWQDISIPVSETSASAGTVLLVLVTNPSVVVGVVLTVAFWVGLGWPRIGHQWRLVSTDIVVLVMLLITAGFSMWDASIAPLPVMGTLMFNILTFLISAGLMREGLADGDRRQFWFGLILLILQIISRVFEYDTGLLLKSFTFLACGICIIIIGLWFERYVRALSESSGSIQPSHSLEE